MTNAFDERKRLTSTALTAPGSSETIAYRYDAANRRRVEQIGGANPKSSVFEFDARLPPDRGQGRVRGGSRQRQDTGTARCGDCRGRGRRSQARRTVRRSSTTRRTRRTEVIGDRQSRQDLQLSDRPSPPERRHPELQPQSRRHGANGGAGDLRRRHFGRVIAVRAAGAALCEIKYKRPQHGR